MSNRNWSRIAILVGISALFISFQNFTTPPGKPQKAIQQEKPDFNSLINESHNFQKDLEKNISTNRSKNEGLIQGNGQMKRTIIEGSGESVIAKDSEVKFRGPAKVKNTDKDNLDRVSQELESQEP